MLLARPSTLDDTVGFVPIQSKDVLKKLAESPLSSDLMKLLEKLEDVNEADSSAFEPASAEKPGSSATGNSVFLVNTSARTFTSLQMPKLESPRLRPLLINDESKEALKSGSGLKLENNPVVVDDYPPKRRPDVVEISTSRWLLPRLRYVKRETQDHPEIEFLNPKFKIKRPKEAVHEILGSAFRRVDALSTKPFLLPDRLDRDLLDFTVSREFTSSMYGGNPQQTLPTISKDNCARHPYRDFMYLNLQPVRASTFWTPRTVI
ncbi:hypothetical protein H2248_005666 [Termitomyces sp. 'cryptogamus']|nr:hypothetical protein H2248_005666 [Termitomyces sp. 'cryptogamus']